MPCGTTHRFINFTATASYLASRPEDQQKGLAHPLVGGTASALLASLPDAIEPAIHPHHRQFFHSIAFAALLVGSAYLLHLAADLFSARSLHVLGR